MRLPTGGVVAGWAALRLAGGGFFDGLEPDGTTQLPIPLVIPPGTNLRPGPGTVIRRERLAPAESVVLHGIPCASPLRAAYDEVRRSDQRAGVVVLDMALAAGLFTLVVLDDYLRTKAGSPGYRTVCAARKLVDGASRSPRETRLRLIWVLDAGLPHPLCNAMIGDAHGCFVGQPDLFSPELGVVGEFDGAFHRGRDRHRRDVARVEAFRDCGLEPFTVVGSDLRDVDLVVHRMVRAVDRAAHSGLTKAWTVRRR